MKRRFVIVAGLALVLLMAAIYFWRPGPAPAGQPPLVSLSSSNQAEFQGAFDQHANEARLVLLLSPT